MIVLKFDLPQSSRKSKAMTCLSKLGISFGMAGFLAMWLMVVTLHAQPVNSSTQNKVPGKTWGQMSTVERIQFVCIASAVITLFVAEVWFIVAGFKTSVLWGLFMLFIGGMRSIGAVLAMIGWMIMWTKITRQSEPFHLPIMIGAAYAIFSGCGVIIFLVRHWDQARKPLAVMSIGVLLILAVLGLEMTK
jgi:hypothetical protein